MDLQARKYEFMEQLFKLDQSNIMDKLEHILYGSKVDQRDTIESYNKALDEAVSEIESGEFYTHEEVERMSKKW